MVKISKSQVLKNKVLRTLKLCLESDFRDEVQA